MLRVVLDRRAIAALQKLSPDDRAAVVAALRELPAGFGRPHIHAGLGLRQLSPGIYEGRSRLRWRFAFEREGDELVIKTVGNHDDIRRWLQQRL